MDKRTDTAAIVEASPRPDSSAGQGFRSRAGGIGSVSLYRRCMMALLAGLIAIFLNMALLALADWLGLPTARGGLLRLLLQLSGGGIQIPAGPLFQAVFHVLVGLGMAVFYALALQPFLTRIWSPIQVLGRAAWLQGLFYAAVVWIANAALVLPLTGEGFAGSLHLSMAGMLWFAAAHTLFFLALAMLYCGFCPAVFGGGPRRDTST